MERNLKHGQLQKVRDYGAKGSIDGEWLVLYS